MVKFASCCCYFRNAGDWPVAKIIATTAISGEGLHRLARKNNMQRSFACWTRRLSPNVVNSQRGVHTNTSPAPLPSSLEPLEPTKPFKRTHGFPSGDRGTSRRTEPDTSNGTAEFRMEDGLLMIRPPALPIAAPAANEYPIRHFKVRACAGLYNLPYKGLDFDTNVVDTGSQPYFYTNPYGVRTLIPAPIVLFIHDTPGSHEDFGACIKLFSQCGARVIAPNFPGFGHTSIDPQQLYGHDTVQRATFVFSVLERLNVNRVDMIIALGHGCVTAVPLASRLKMPVRSLCLINPMPAVPPRKTVPFAKFEFISSLHKVHYFRPYLGAAVDYLSSVIDPERRFPDQIARASMVMGYGGTMYDKYVRQLQELPFETIDTLFLMTQDDPLFSKFELAEVGHVIGATKDRLSIINDRNEMTRGAPVLTERQYLRGVCFESGGRMPHVTQARMVQQLLLELYNFTCRKFGMRLRMSMASTPQTAVVQAPVAKTIEESPTWGEREGAVIVGKRKILPEPARKAAVG